MATTSTSSRRRGLLLGTDSGRDAVRRIAVAVMALAAVTVVGTLGYVLLGFGLLDALYQTVTTVATVGFREVQPLSAVGQVFTIVLIILGVGTVLYNLGVLVEAVTEGHVREYLWRRRMDQDIARLRDHVIVCGHGRVGRSATRQLTDTGHQVVVVDSDPSRLSGVLEPHVLGDASQDDTLREAGIEHARALICALGTDAETLYATLSARALRPDLVIISRARTLDSKDKLVRAGATRAVNPQLIGGRRMASFALHGDVAEFLDGVMHSDEVDHEFEQVTISSGSAFAGKRLADIDLFREMSVPVLAVRQPHQGAFLTNPPRSTVMEAGSTLILLASTDQIAAVHRAAGTSD